MGQRPKKGGGRAKPTHEELVAELRVLRKTKTTDGWLGVIQAAFKWGVLGWLGLCAVWVARELAGKATAAHFGVQLLGDLRMSDAVALLLGGGGTVYGVRQRRLRREVTERLQARNRELEKRVDVGRSSSGLTPRGETREEDK